MQFTRHALDRMKDKGLTRGEVLAIIVRAARGRHAPVARDAIEHFGFDAKGRPFNVVTNRSRTIVITVAAE